VAVAAIKALTFVIENSQVRRPTEICQGCSSSPSLALVRRSVYKLAVVAIKYTQRHGVPSACAPVSWCAARR